MYDKLDRFVIVCESRIGSRLTSLAIALLLMISASIYVRPAVKCVALGRLYASMASDPFVIESSNYVGYRLLTPTISYLLGLRGETLIVTNLLIATILLAVVFGFFRKYAPRPGDALVASGALAFSLVTLTTIYYGGYCDSLTYLIAFFMWQHRHRPTLLYSLFLAGMLNRESLIFLMPWFIYLRWMEIKSASRLALETVIGMGIAVLAYLSYRSILSPHLEHGYTAGFYLDPVLKDPLHWIRKSFGRQGLGWFTVFKGLWLFIVLGAISLWKSDLRRETMGLVLMLVLVWSQSIIAYDSSRVATLSFLAMPICLLQLMKTNAFEFRRWAPGLLLLNLLIPQMYTASSYIEMMYSTPANIIRLLIIDGAKW